MAFDYCFFFPGRSHCIYYRPALLNGRHVVDVLRAVCGPADVSEAELDDIRRRMTERARAVQWVGEGWKGVWETYWNGAAITAKM